MMDAAIVPMGDLQLEVVRPHRAFPVWPSVNAESFRQHALPHRGLGAEVNEFRRANVRNVWRGFWRQCLAARIGVPSYYGALWMSKRHGDTGVVVPLGLASLRVVTTAGVGYLVDAMQNLVEPENMKYHGFGTGTTAEATSDTALVTELTTQYATDNVRPTGTLTEGASANIFRTVATLTPDSGSPVLREHGIFSQAATGGGVLLDRTVFAAVTLDTTVGDSLQVTYELTFPAGG